MLPNPLAPTMADTDAAALPQLRLAARTGMPPDPQTTIAAAVQEVVSRSHGQWRGTLDAVKETLATLERDCASAVEAQEARVAGLIDTLVGNAAAAADAAAQQTRAQAEVEIAELQRALAALQAIVNTLQTDLAAERDSVKAINAQREIEVAARVHAETERDEARRRTQQQIAAAESERAEHRAEVDAQKAEFSLLRQQLDAAVADRSKLMATFQTVQRALALGTSETVNVPTPEWAHTATTSPESRPHPVGGESRSAPEVPASDPVADARIALNALHPDAVADVMRVLDQVEAMYQLDLEAGRSGLEIVDALAASLRYARDAMVARWSSDDCDADTLFEYQIGERLQTHAGTSLGRHLSVAAYASRQAAAAPALREAGNVQDNVS